MERLLGLTEGVVGESARRGEVEQTLGEAAREGSGPGGEDGGGVAFGRLEQWSGDLFPGQQIERDGGAGLPVGRELEDGGTADAAVGDEEFVAEADGIFAACAAGWSAGEFGFGGDPAETFETGGVLRAQSERDERRAGRHNAEAELPGELVPKACGAELGDRKAAGGDDHRSAEDALGAAIVGELESEAFGGALEFAEVGSEAEFGSFSLFEKQRDELARGAVAKELARSFGVVSDAVALDERDKLLGRVAGEGGFGKMGVFAEKVLGARVEVGEIGAAPTGDKNFASRLGGVVDDKNAEAALGEQPGREQARGACAEDGGVVGHSL